jgi:hypothetical protein
MRALCITLLINNLYPYNNNNNINNYFIRRLSECLGRRNALIANGWCNVFAALLEFCSKSFASPELLIMGRLILGANMGLSVINGTTSNDVNYKKKITKQFSAVII